MKTYTRKSPETSDRKLNEKGYETDPNENIVISYLALRKLIGGLGVSLPIILIIASSVHNSDLLPSISHYFHSSMKIIFTGILFSIATFLWTYNGEDKEETWICKITSILAALIAILPTKNEKNYLEKGKLYSYEIFNKFECPSIQKPDHVGILHLVFAAFFFLSLVYLILCKFLPHERKSMEPRISIIRIYKVCGWGMLISIAFIAILKIIPILPMQFPFTFFFESIALFLFGFAWLVKGEALNNF